MSRADTPFSPPPAVATPPGEVPGQCCGDETCAKCCGLRCAPSRHAQSCRAVEGDGWRRWHRSWRTRVLGAAVLVVEYGETPAGSSAAGTACTGSNGGGMKHPREQRKHLKRYLLSRPAADVRMRPAAHPRQRR
ncbi:hypothetical protein GCM10022255_101730 [Dactylosporangium darangshiense]|uniref:Uncharacterized protein n=1 Tax=Dactylosporangium darangshiense TaxID=579108 RepID=A0ABP8DS26_9ACTN